MTDVAALLAQHESALRAYFKARLRKWPKVAATTTADDLTQITMLNAFTGWDGFRGDADFKTWLFRIADNAFQDAGRQQRRSRISYDNAELDDVAADNPETLAIRAETDAVISTPKRTRAVKRPAAAQEFTPVPVSGGAGDLIGAFMLLATVAYPESWTRRDRAIEAMKAVCFRIARYNKRKTPPAASRILVAMPAQQMHNTMRRLSRRLGQRFEGAEAAALLMIDVHKDGVPMQLTDFARQYRGGRARFMRDAWAPEVMHLALALRSVILHRDDPTLPQLLVDPIWAPEALNHAERLIGLLSKLEAERPSLRGLRTSRFIRLIPE